MYISVAVGKMQGKKRYTVAEGGIMVSPRHSSTGLVSSGVNLYHMGRRCLFSFG